MISRSEILMGRDVLFPLDSTKEANLEKLLRALNIFRAAFGKPMRVSSGYRPGHFNTSAGGAEKSCHPNCEACDFHDADGELKRFALANVELLERAGLYMEDPSRTPTWLHLQTRPTKRRIFLP